MSFSEDQAESYRSIFGNPGTLKLHEALSDIEDWLDYEASVVEEAADDIEDTDISDAADEQAEAMEDAAEAVGEAADAARDTAAEVFNDTGVATSENVGDGTPEGDAIGGNPGGDGRRVYVVPYSYAGENRFARFDTAEKAADFAKDAGGFYQEYEVGESGTEIWRNRHVVEGNPVGDAIGGNPFYIDSQHPDHAHHWTRRGTFDSREDAEAYMAEWFPDDEKWQLIVTQGNPAEAVAGADGVVEGNPVGDTTLPDGRYVNAEQQDNGGWYVVTGRGDSREVVQGPSGSPVVFATRADAENYISNDLNPGDFGPVVQGNPGENPLPVETDMGDAAPDEMPESVHPFFRPLGRFGGR